MTEVSESAAVEISVIIVSYNTRAMTLDCLRSLCEELGTIRSEVILVDNASADGTAQAVRDAYPQVMLIESSKNIGFGPGNNLAMAKASGRYLLLLNTDAFMLPGALRNMAAYLDAHPKAAMVGPRVLNADGSLQPSCYRFPSPGRAWLENLFIAAAFKSHSNLGDYRQWAHDQDRTVDWVIGACCLLRREVYTQLGGFDERFFMYAEETDWQQRMRSAGWDIGFTPSAKVTHLGGASGASEQPKINRHFFDSLDLYERKHHGLSGLLSVRTAMLVGCTIRLVLWTGVLAFIPARRAVAAGKVKLMSWLLWRQSTHWRVSVG